MPPEKFTSARFKAGPKSDMWCLGLIIALFERVVGIWAVVAAALRIVHNAAVEK